MTNLTTSKPSTVDHPSTPPPRPVTLETLQQQLSSIGHQVHRMVHDLERMNTRVTRVETRLVRLMETHGLDADGFLVDMEAPIHPLR